MALSLEKNIQEAIQKELERYLASPASAKSYSLSMKEISEWLNSKEES